MTRGFLSQISVADSGKMSYWLTVKYNYRRLLYRATNGHFPDGTRLTVFLFIISPSKSRLSPDFKSTSYIYKKINPFIVNKGIPLLVVQITLTNFNHTNVSNVTYVLSQIFSIYLLRMVATVTYTQGRISRRGIKRSIGPGHQISTGRQNLKTS